MAEFTEPITICNESDINNDEVKEFNFDENNKLLLIRQNERLWAVGATCPHRGAPLIKCVLGRGRIRCSRHGACFNIKTGDIEDFPGLDSLPKYPVEIGKEGEVQVRARHRDLNKIGRTKDMVAYQKSDERLFLLVGGGPASATCAETLRQEGYTGRIVMLCREKYLPYDRTILSKVLDFEIDDIYLRDAEFYKKNHIDILLGVEATKLDTKKKTVTCSNGKDITYDKLFIATGARPCQISYDEESLRNVFTLRDIGDMRAMMSFFKPKSNVVCIGGGYISLEISSVLVSKVKSVVLIYPDKYPLEMTFGDEIGARLLSLYEERGVRMKMESRVMDIISEDGIRATEVKTTDGQKYQCDIILVAIGTKPNTEWLNDSDVPVNSSGFINTDMNLMTPVPDIYVGGDIANAPVLTEANQRMPVEHYQVAQYHGRIAGINMAGNIQELRTVPKFTSLIFGMQFLQIGCGMRHDVFIYGDLKRLKYVAYVFDADGNVSYVGTCGYDSIVISFSELMAQGKRLHRSEVSDKSNPNEWIEQLLDSRRMRCDCK